MSALDEAWYEIRPHIARMLKNVLTIQSPPAISSLAKMPLCYLGRRQMRKILPTALGIHHLSDTDERVGGTCRNVFMYQYCSLTYINVESYIQLLASKAITSTQGSLALKFSSTFEHLIYFRSLSYFEKLPS